MGNTEMDDPRTELANVINACKAKFLDLPEGHDRALADAIVDGLDRRGLVIAEMGDVIEPPDEHLRTLKSIRKIVREAIENDPSGRDLASLSRRLQDVSKEVTVLEERHRTEKAERGKSTNGSSTSRTTGAAEDGSLRI
jgi:hypothetical protein